MRPLAIFGSAAMTQMGHPNDPSALILFMRATAASCELKAKIVFVFPHRDPSTKMNKGRFIFGGRRVPTWSKPALTDSRNMTRFRTECRVFARSRASIRKSRWSASPMASVVRTDEGVRFPSVDTRRSLREKTSLFSAREGGPGWLAWTWIDWPRHRRGSAKRWPIPASGFP